MIPRGLNPSMNILLQQRGKKRTRFRKNTMNVRKALMVKPGKKVKLSDYDPDDTLGHEKGPRTDAKIEKACKRLDSLQYLLYAEKKHALLVVFQALDAGGKD